MGLFDVFRHRRERESALGQIQAEGGSASYGDPPAPSAQVPGQGADWTDLLKGMAGGQVNVTQAQQSIDLRDVQGLREDVINALRQHGVDPQNPGAIDASSVPGLQEAMLSALQSHGVDFGALAGMAGNGTIAAAGAGTASGLGDADAIAAQLKQLDDLRAQGVLNDSEYRQQRQKLLDQL